MAETPSTDPGVTVEVRRSARRRRTVAAYREAGKVIVLIPARMSKAEERDWVAKMVKRLGDQDLRRRPSDEKLLRRSAELSRRFLGGRAVASSVRWVVNQNSRWGSCTPADGAVRLSTRLQGMPAWVVDYVLVHELAHLLEVGHTPRFWELVAAYPRTERARGFLEGVGHAAGLAPLGDDFDGAVDDVLAGSGVEVS
jgi:predicted metal-dependent hydrolase